MKKVSILKSTIACFIFFSFLVSVRTLAMPYIPDIANKVSLPLCTPTSSTTNITVCNSALPFSWNGLTFTGAGTQTAILTNAGGCDSSATLNLSVKSAAHSTTVTGTMFICNNGNTSQLTANNIGGTWSSNSTFATVTNTGLVKAVGAIQATIKYVCDNDTVSNSFSVAPIRTSLSAITGPTKVCAGATVQLLNNVLNDVVNKQNAATGLWTVTNSGRGTINQSGILTGGTPGANALVQYTITNKYGCTGVMNYTVAVNANPTLKPTVSGPTTVCQNSTVQLTGNPAGSTNTWSVQNTGRGSFTTTGLLTGITSGGNANVLYTYADANGCISPTATYSVYINSLPAKPSISIANVPYCINTLLQLAGSPAGGSWISNKPAASVSPSGVLKVLANDSFSITYTSLPDVNGCTNFSTLLRKASNCTVAAATAPDAPANVTAVATGSTSATVNFTAPANNGGSAITGYIATSNPNGITGTCNASSSSINISGLTAGTNYTFTVQAINLAGASSASSPSNSVTTLTVPGKPLNVVATASNGKATLTFNAPANNGGSPILGYTATSNPGGISGSSNGSSTSITIIGLTNGVNFTFTVVAVNAQGSSAASSPSNSVIPATVPSSPRNVTAVVSGNNQVTLSFTAPVSSGGVAITGYTATSSPGGITGTCSGSQHSIIVSGLTAGTSYTFTVTATNAAGIGAGSISNSVTPASVPNPPTNIIGVGGYHQVTLAFSPPTSNGGSSIIGYTATSSPGGISGSSNGASPSLRVLGLTNGISYTFSIVAINAIGSSTPALSNTIIPASQPLAPTNVVATGGSHQASISFDPPADNGGYVITSYTATSSPDGITGTCDGSTNNITVSGLTNGTTYTFTVTATNAIGTSGPSAPSASVDIIEPDRLNVKHGIDFKVSKPLGIYPNPARGIVTINNEQLTMNNSRLTIADMTGKVLKTQVVTDKQTKVDVNGLKPGMYIITILSSEGKKTEKLMVE